jgi:hypothetical protein
MRSMYRGATDREHWLTPPFVDHAFRSPLLYTAPPDEAVGPGTHHRRSFVWKSLDTYESDTRRFLDLAKFCNAKHVPRSDRQGALVRSRGKQPSTRSVPRPVNTAPSPEEAVGTPELFTGLLTRGPARLSIGLARRPLGSTQNDSIREFVHVPATPHSQLYRDPPSYPKHVASFLPRDIRNIHIETTFRQDTDVIFTRITGNWLFLARFNRKLFGNVLGCLTIFPI